MFVMSHLTRSIIMNHSYNIQHNNWSGSLTHSRSRSGNLSQVTWLVLILTCPFKIDAYINK